MSSVEALEMFLAAVRAVAPRAAGGGPGVQSGPLLAWVERADPVQEILALLTEREHADLRHVLDGMCREHEVLASPALR